VNIPVVTVGPAGDVLAAQFRQVQAPVTVVRCCGELSELLAACQSGLARAAVITLGSGQLTATLVDRVTAVGVAVLVLTDDAEETARLQAIGTFVAPVDCPPIVLADWIVAVVASFADPFQASGDPVRPAAPDRTQHGGREANLNTAAAAPVQPPANPAAGPPAGQRKGWADGRSPTGSTPHGPTSGGTAPPPTTPGPQPSNNQPSNTASSGPPGLRIRPVGAAPAGPAAGANPASQVLAVWGPAGAPGRTTVAVNVAAEAAAEGRKVLLVDADTYGASVAVQLGLLDESAGLAQACRLADQGLLTAEGLQRVVTRVQFTGGHLGVLTGLTRPDRWPELRASAMNLVLQRCRAAADLIVVDCGFCLEADEELSYDTRAPQRNAATLRALAAADTVLAVGAADAIGVPRLVRALPALESVAAGARVAVLINKVRAGAAGSNPERELRHAWERFGPGTSITAFLPWDPQSVDRALLTGQLLLEAAPTSPLRQAIASIICAPAQRGRRRPVKTARATALFPR
jgi:MinD-like ATPase involved in chromosome partitioning or flagellar assembly